MSIFVKIMAIYVIIMLIYVIIMSIYVIVMSIASPDTAFISSRKAALSRLNQMPRLLDKFGLNENHACA